MLNLTNFLPRPLAAWMTTALLLWVLLTQMAWAAQVVTRGDYEVAIDMATPAWVERRELPAEWAMEAPLRYWLLDMQVDRRAGQQWRYHDWALDVGSAELLSDAGRIELSFRPEYEQLTIHQIAIRRQGQWLDRLDTDKLQLTPRKSQFEQNVDTSDVSLLLVVDDLRVGDVLRVNFSVRGHNPVLGELRSHNLITQLPIPVQFLRHRFWFDPGTRLAQREVGDPVPAKLAELENALQWQVTATDLPAQLDESQTPSGYESWDGWQLTPERSWADVVSWAQPLYTPASLQLPESMQQERDRLMQLADPHERTAAALSLVQEQVRYVSIVLGESSHKPALPSETWARRWGDCKDKSVLLVALLRDLGITAAPALVSIEKDRYLDRQLPAADVFDHAIVRASIDGVDYWLDPTIVGQKGPLPMRHGGLLGYALPLADEANELVAIEPPSDWSVRVIATEQFSPPSTGNPFADPWQLTVTTEHHGPSAQAMRSLIRAQGEAQLERDYAEFYGRQYAGLSRLEPIVVSDQDDGRMVVVERYQLSNPLQAQSAGVHYLEPTVLGINDVITLPPGDQREHPLGLSFPADFSYTAILDLPSGWSWLDQEQSGDYGSAGFSYQYRQALTGQRLQQDHQVRTLRAELTPDQAADHYRAVQRSKERFGLRMRVHTGKEADQDSLEERRRRALEALLEAGG